ncbi:AfsR/SARP family transcriptional regulator [Streptomyces sp. UNOC14_S4]|uniref:AfsR/SARP family transcriptional regulator n=1 Tax=Streptomyces sp. UNOC14_S4 TaxID=2872340 RepID=UPI001E4EFA0C|nr:AfsR/SARP family transcriptional regulator [Streptomyces sp. UNOC14_S4]MCC3769291.1 AfsR/SARP family transcriptional regulator [Streptomyces sp. UNOC14_S4]
MDVGVLGPLVMAADGVTMVPSAPKPRQLLALFILNANRMVPAQECVTELWGAQPPKSAISTVQTYVLHIRHILREASKTDRSRTLVTRNQGYQLLVDPGRCDRVVFDDLLRRGRQAVVLGEDAWASARFAEALGLWRGPALADVRTGPVSSAHVVELEETRNGVLEQRIEADLRLGRHVDLLDELGELTSLHPTHENLHAQFMLALYRSGKRAWALEVFRRLHRVLGDRLGIEPAPRMQRLYQALLAGSPVLDAPAARLDAPSSWLGT